MTDKDYILMKSDEGMPLSRIQRFKQWLLTEPDDTDLFLVHIRQAVQTVHKFINRSK